MKISLISFTKNGFETEKRLAFTLKAAGHEACPYVMGKYALQAAAREQELNFSPVREGGLSSWAGERFGDSDGLIFVGACGIAVRAIAPHVKDKKTDPAVLVLDEAGRFVIPVLSGHLGGANELALGVSEGLGCQPVITTATDVNRKFAVDTFAKERGLIIDDLRLAKEVSAAVLAGEPVGLFCDFPVGDALPEGLYRDRICGRNLRISVRRARHGEENTVLRLIPRCVALGLGCRRGTPKEKLLSVIRQALEAAKIDIRSVCALASIDLKSGEAGLCELSGELGIPFLTYTGEELLAVPGEFSYSEFVERTTGVGNVCERAAMAACMEVAKSARLLAGKYAADGVTVAAACFVPELFGNAEERAL